jgi:hypothetical protein
MKPPVPIVAALFALPSTLARADVTSVCATAPNSVGPGAVLSWIGPGNPQFGSLAVAGCPPHSVGRFVYGLAQHQVPFGDGWSCVAGANWVLARRTTDAQGALTMSIWRGGDSEDLAWLTYVSNWGATWTFQYLYRDPLGPGGTGHNGTQALSVVFTPW